MIKQTSFFGAIVTLILVLTNVASADVPQLISFQGKLYDNAGNSLTGQYEITFRIYNVESGGTQIWIETSTVSCDNGLYNVILGLTTPMNLDFDRQYWLGVQVTGDEELLPRYRLVSVPYSFRTQVADQVTWTGLTDVPEGFADGIDDVGEAGGISQINAGTGITVTNPVGPSTTVAADIGTGADKVAAGDHSHDASYINEGQANSVTSSMIVDGTIQEADLSFTPGGDNDWTVNGGNIYRETGNVGIGTQSPTSKLHVLGSSSYEPILTAYNSGLGEGVYGYGNYGVSGESDISGGCGVLGITNTTGGYGVYGWSSNGDGTGVGGVSNSGKGLHGESSNGWAGYFEGKTYISGNVGIGTKTPSEQLHVKGTSGTTVTAFLQPYEFNSAGDYGELRLGDANHYIRGEWGTGMTLYDIDGIFLTGGNVGIGTTSPDYMLDVSGSLRIDGLRVEPHAGSPNIIGGYSGNSVTAGVEGATIGGGGQSGYANSVTANYGTVGGGANNTSGNYATVGGGANNTSGGGATVGGGAYNQASLNHATVGGGYFNTASSYGATVPGGYHCNAQGDCSFAAGRQAKANHHGAFVWADDTYADFASTGDNQFLIRASGGVGIGTNNPGYTLDVAGPVNLNKGGTGTALRVDGAEAIWYNGSYFSWGYGGTLNYFADNVGININAPAYTLHVIGSIAYTGDIYDVSDVRLKENITPLEGAAEKISSIQGIFFNNKGEDPEKREIGVIAQDVEKVLPEIVGEDAEGYKSVAYSKLTPLLIEAIKELKAENEALKERIELVEVKLQE